MAQKLHDQYKYSYDNLKVLLGGWNTWKQQNATDSKTYPIDTSAGAAPGAAPGANNAGGSSQPGAIVITPAITPKP